MRLGDDAELDEGDRAGAEDTDEVSPETNNDGR
jgi:hypothetical protein